MTGLPRQGAFSFPDDTTDPVNGAKFIRDLYEKSGDTLKKYTVPVRVRGSMSV